MGARRNKHFFVSANARGGDASTEELINLLDRKVKRLSGRFGTEAVMRALKDINEKKLGSIPIELRRALWEHEILNNPTGASEVHVSTRGILNDYIQRQANKLEVQRGTDSSGAIAAMQQH